MFFGRFLLKIDLMIDVELIRKDPERVKRGIAAKNGDPKLVEEFLIIDDDWRQLKAKIEYRIADQKRVAGDKDFEKAKKAKEDIKNMKADFENIEAVRTGLLYKFPNLPFDEVPVGKDESYNVITKEAGEKKKFGFTPKDYLALAENLDLIDVKRASKVSGSRYGYIKNQAAVLEFALVQLAIKKLIPKGFHLVIPPVMIKEEMMKGMGYIDSEKDLAERYYFEEDKMFFVGTAEQSIGPMHSDETLKAAELPLRYLGFSTCFRREAGSYGKDTKGILRVHQFDKMEMFSFAKPEESKEEHKFLVEAAEELLQALEIPYRLVHLCTGDIAQPSAVTHDIECWLPGQNGGKGQYRETNSISNVTDFQSRRLKIKYKDEKTGKSEYVHMLNGTAFAIGRVIIAILENYQQEDGSILVPDVLKKYVNFEKIG